MPAPLISRSGGRMGWTHFLPCHKGSRPCQRIPGRRGAAPREFAPDCIRASGEMVALRREHRRRPDRDQTAELCPACEWPVVHSVVSVGLRVVHLDRNQRLRCRTAFGRERQAGELGVFPSISVPAALPQHNDRHRPAHSGGGLVHGQLHYFRGARVALSRSNT